LGAGVWPALAFDQEANTRYVTTGAGGQDAEREIQWGSSPTLFTLDDGPKMAATANGDNFDPDQWWSQTARSTPLRGCQKLTTMVNLARVSTGLTERRRPAMNVNLGSAFDGFVAELLASGLYQSQSEILREGLRLLKEREDLRKARLEGLRKEIAIGVEQADRGEFVDGKRVFQELRRRSGERRRKAS
jgi:antitoxin ParD1/3/4